LHSKASLPPATVTVTPLFLLPAADSIPALTPARVGPCPGSTRFHPPSALPTDLVFRGGVHSCSRWVRYGEAISQHGARETTGPASTSVPPGQLVACTCPWATRSMWLTFHTVRRKSGQRSHPSPGQLFPSPPNGAESTPWNGFTPPHPRSHICRSIHCCASVPHIDDTAPHTPPIFFFTFPCAQRGKGSPIFLTVSDPELDPLLFSAVFCIGLGLAATQKRFGNLSPVPGIPPAGDHGSDGPLDAMIDRVPILRRKDGVLNGRQAASLAIPSLACLRSFPLRRPRGQRSE
jgi:hypothetical protein